MPFSTGWMNRSPVPQPHHNPRRLLPESSPAPGAATSAPPSETDGLVAGALAIIHAAPGTALAAHEIPADSVGGFVYTGGSLQLADLKDRGVRYTGLTGVEWQGWLRARETGRYELDLDGSTVSPNTVNSATCVFTGWLEDRSIGLQQATAQRRLGRAAPFSLILGAALHPACTSSALGRLQRPMGARSARPRSRCLKKPRPTSTCVPSPLMISHTSNAE